MRSLQLLVHQSSTICSVDRPSRTFIANDPENNTTYVAFEDDASNLRVLLNGITPGDDLAFVELCRVPISDPQYSGNFIVDFTYLADQQVACLAARNGDIMLFSKERFDNGEEALDVVGSVESGIEAMTWSPDQDLVVLVTGSKNVLEMTQEFDTITEFPLHVEHEGEGVQHSVGWGRKETQFHGRAGKQAALSKIDTSKFTVSEDDDQKARISWRGDGSCFVVSDIDSHKAARVARIYNREGILQNTSEPVDRLEHVLDWRPSGNLIVSSQRLPHRHDIVFFEKNGLRHGEFSLREKTKHKLLEVSWNADSTVLAIWLEAEDAHTQKVQKTVQLWTSNNYYWYMKQHLKFPEGQDILGFQWDVESPLCAHIVTSGGQYHKCTFATDVLTSTSVGEDNPGYVAVIDGASVLLTPFGHQNVPPPMCALKLAVDYNVQQVAFGPDSTGTRLAVATNQAIKFYELPVAGRGEGTFVGSVDLARFAESLRERQGVIRHLCWISESQVAFVQYSEGLDADILCVATVSPRDNKIESILHTRLPDDAAIRLYFNATFKDLMVETVKGSVFEVCIDDDITLVPAITFPSVCTWIATTRTNRNSAEPERIVIGLSDRSKLYANDRLLSAECTSFFLRNDWLALTTTSHNARFLPLDIPFNEFKISDNAPSAHDESYRRVERGAKIVLALQLKPNLVLQMPRGNLETVSPRAFVLAQIREDLKNLSYRSAFIACRRNRIDLNILYDYDPQRFFEHIPKFIEQVPEVDYLNLFLSTLKNEDTTKTLYQHAGQASPEALSDASDKVNKICKAFRDVLFRLGRDKYIQSILSTYVKSTPPELEAALGLLADIRETSINDAEEALKYTIFLCDAASLYDVALGMYNFTLVLMVAQQAQMDPREYLPFLQELQKLDKFYQRFRIDDHLKRYDSALRNLSRAGDSDHFDELLEYMKRHSLYKVALEEYGTKPNQKKLILDAYGDYLSSRNTHDEAAMVYRMCDRMEKALNAYKQAGSWKEAFALAKELNYTADALQGLAYDVIEYLKDKSRHQEAAVVAVDYAQDIEEAVDCLLKGNQWKEAARVARTHERSDLIETHVKPGVYDGYTQVDEDLNEMVNQFNKQKSRLHELRQTKPEPTEILPHDESLDNIDMFSDTTSMYSQFTRYTQASSRMSTLSTVSSKASKKSSKVRRREQRKKERGKKGTVYEEEYLVKSLRRLYERSSQMQNDIHNLLKAMVPYGWLDEARQLQEKFAAFLVTIKEEIPAIFIPLQLPVGKVSVPSLMYIHLCDDDDNSIMLLLVCYTGGDRRCKEPGGGGKAFHPGR
ncbi:IKI3 family-domain-containing protein [Dichotomocladium elegans]|nr:IKI3 family-domain-containing protein [Dichotomocladium elegans]